MNLFSKKEIGFEKNEISGGRLCYLDNVRFFLILIVVCAHFIECTSIYRPLYKFIYMFHMPAFIFLSGYFAKENYSAKKNLGLCVLYLLCYTIFFCFGNFVLGKANVYSPLNPNPFIGLWYLLSLVLWSLLFPIYAKMKAVYAIVIVILIGLLVGLDKNIGSFLSLSRTFVFFPFYVLGYYANKTQFLTKAKKLRFVPVISVVIILIFAYIMANYASQVNGYVLTAKRSYAEMKMQPFEGILSRAGWYFAATLLSLAFYMLVPSKKLMVTYMGRNTIAVYFFHLLIIYWLKNSKFFPVFSEKCSNPSIFLITIMVTVVFAQPIFSQLFNRVMKGDYFFLKKEESKK